MDKNVEGEKVLTYRLMVAQDHLQFSPLRLLSEGVRQLFPLEVWDCLSYLQDFPH